jgi:putative ABC transport system substrate-binding protein
VLSGIKPIHSYAIGIRTNCEAEGLALICASSMELWQFWDMRLFLTTNKILIALIFSICLWANPVFAEKTSHILIIANSNDTPLQEAINGFKQQITARGNIKFTEMLLPQTQAPAVRQVDSIKPDLIYALGVDAAKWASLQTSSIPIVATMVLKEDVFRQAPNITGVSLGYSLQTQFQWLKKFFPQQKAVAVLFNPAENAATVLEAQKAGLQNGFNLVAIPVESPKQLPFALEQLANNIEILLAIPDETVMSVNTAKEVLLASFRNKVPFIGLSDNWVKSGAFYALSWDYADLGQQSAELALKILNGASIKTISPEHPRKVTYTINAKIAEHMKMDIPEAILKNAKIVFN